MKCYRVIVLLIVSLFLSEAVVGDAVALVKSHQPQVDSGWEATLSHCQDTVERQQPRSSHEGNACGSCCHCIVGSCGAAIDMFASSFAPDSPVSHSFHYYFSVTTPSDSSLLRPPINA